MYQMSNKNSFTLLQILSDDLIRIKCDLHILLPLYM